MITATLLSANATDRPTGLAVQEGDYNPPVKDPNRASSYPSEICTDSPKTTRIELPLLVHRRAYYTQVSSTLLGAINSKL